MKADLLGIITTPLLNQLKKESEVQVRNQLLRSLGQASFTFCGKEVAKRLCEIVVANDLIGSEGSVDAVLFGLQKAAVQAEVVLECNELWKYINTLVKEDKIKEHKQRA